MTNFKMVLKVRLRVTKKDPALPKNFLKNINLYLILFGDFKEKKL
jgi:hypothetical protein